MAPVSTSEKPRRRARILETVDFPAPAGPSMATMKGRLGMVAGQPAAYPGWNLEHKPLVRRRVRSKADGRRRARARRWSRHLPLGDLAHAVDVAERVSGFEVRPRGVGYPAGDDAAGE